MTADRSPLRADSDNLWQRHRLNGGGWMGQDGRWWRGWGWSEGCEGEKAGGGEKGVEGMRGGEA